MHAVSYRTAGFDEIGRIRPLWEQLNRHHHARASHCKTHYERMTFEVRPGYFQKIHESGQLYLTLHLTA